jgi:hypothetical protein
MISYLVFAVCFFMLLMVKGNKESQLASLFLISLELITAIYNCCLEYHYNYLIMLYCIISVCFSALSLKQTYNSVFGYILYSWVYFIIAIEDTMYEYSYIPIEGFLDRNYTAIMLGCLVILAYLVIHDKLVICARRAYIFMFKFLRPICRIG